MSTDTLFVAVMGVTGSGKSTFISKATGHEIPIGQGLESCKNTTTSSTIRELIQDQVQLL